MLMSKYRNKLRDANGHVVSLQAALAGAFVVICFLMVMYNQARETQLIRVPPDLRQGVVMRANDVPPPLVYSFTYYIYQQIQNWPNGGEKDFGERIYYLQAFMTPGFRKKLSEELREKTNKGELRNRVRRTQEIYERGYEDARVLIESDESWIVWLDLDVTETVHGKPVKDVSISYAFRVVRYDVDPEQNQWGLAIADFARPAKRLTQKELDSPFERSL